MKLILAATMMLTSTLAFAADTPDDPCSFLGDNGDAQAQLRVNNCRLLLKNKLIPNTAALDYTLRYMRDNTGKLADDRCLPPSVGASTRTIRVRAGGRIVTRQVTSGRTGEQGMSKDVLRQGVKNQCHFLINDTTASIRGFPYRGPAYHVDLCAQNPSKIVTTTYFNKGTGRGHSDISGRHTTVVGAFLTASTSFDFRPYRMSGGYQEILRQTRRQTGKGKIVGVRLFGLNSSNNNTSASKPLHVSPYRSSWGCPSTGMENGPLLERLAANGPSLVMNYGPSSYHRSTTQCFNEGPAPQQGPTVRQLASTAGSREGRR